MEGITMFKKITGFLVLFAFCFSAQLFAAKVEGNSPFVGSQVVYGKDGNTLVPMKVSSDGTLATSATLSGAVLVTKTIDFAASETAQTIWTPTSGKKFVITDMIISCSAAGTITVFDSTDSTANRIVKGYFAANGGLSQPYSKPRTSSTADNVLKYTTGSGIAGSLTIQGYEI